MLHYTTYSIYLFKVRCFTFAKNVVERHKQKNWKTRPKILRNEKNGLFVTARQ